MDYYVVFDLEATCCDNGEFPKKEMETIEIGAVRVDESFVPVGDEFCEFIRPVRHPVLTEFCCKLTTISQAEVDSACGFIEVFEDFTNWCGNDALAGICSWGDYDLKQLGRDCFYHGIGVPGWFLSNHINVRRNFADAYNKKQLCTIPMALDRLGLEFDGTLHRGIDDARNIAAVARAMLQG